jgi:hypothetical protein
MLPQIRRYSRGHGDASITLGNISRFVVFHSLKCIVEFSLVMGLGQIWLLVNGLAESALLRSLKFQILMIQSAIFMKIEKFKSFIKSRLNS